MGECICEYCHKPHDGKHASGRFCSPSCSSKSRRKNRAKTIALKKKQGTYKQNYSPNVSKLEMGVSRMLSEAGITHQVQYKVGKYYFDIRIGNILIQVNGGYWHADPLKYNAGSVVKYPGGVKKLALSVWKRDLRKKLQASKQGYKVVYLWEDDIHNTPEPILVQTVRKTLITGQDIKRITH